MKSVSSKPSDISGANKAFVTALTTEIAGIYGLSNSAYAASGRLPRQLPANELAGMNAAYIGGL